MIIDLHNHTGWGSGDTHIEPSALVDQVKRWGLDGICITEHNQVWDPEKITVLREKHGFLVIGGVEVDTEWGHILAFGLPGRTAGTACRAWRSYGSSWTSTMAC